METFNNIAFIENYLSGKQFRIAGISNENGYQLKKIYVDDNENTSHSRVQQLFPNAKVVQDMDAIIEDNCIGLIIISSPKANDFDKLAHLLRSGKHVRIV